MVTKQQKFIGQSIIVLLYVLMTYASTIASILYLDSGLEIVIAILLASILNMVLSPFIVLSVCVLGVMFLFNSLFLIVAIEDYFDIDPTYE